MCSSNDLVRKASHNLELKHVLLEKTTGKEVLTLLLKLLNQFH